MRHNIFLIYYYILSSNPAHHRLFIHIHGLIRTRYDNSFDRPGSLPHALLYKGEDIARPLLSRFQLAEARFHLL